MLLPPSEWPLTSTEHILASLQSPPMQMSHKISEVTGPKCTKFVAVVMFSLPMVTQQSALQYVPPVVEGEEQHLKKESNICKTSSVGGIAMPGGLIKHAVDCKCSECTEVKIVWFLGCSVSGWCCAVTVQSPNQVKITDFGLAKLLDYNEDGYRAAGGKVWYCFS